MTVRMTRTTPGRPPQSLGVEVDDAGRATGYQTAGNRVGRFARELTAEERDALAAAAREAAAADLAAVPPPTGASEQLLTDDVDARFDPLRPPAGLAGIVEVLRALREDLAGSPVAAIALEVGGSPPAAALRHVGTEPLTVRAATLTVTATLFDADSGIAGTAEHTVDASGVGDEIGPGWRLPLVADVGVAAPGKGGFRTVTVTGAEADAVGDGVLHRVELGWMDE
jgi:hypothetical protein